MAQDKIEEEELEIVSVDKANVEMVIDESIRPSTITSFWIMLLAGVIFSAIFGLLAIGIKQTPLPFAEWFYNLIWKRGPIQFFELIFGGGVIGHVMQKGRLLKLQEKQLSEDPIELGTDLSIDANVTEIRERVRSSADFEESILLTRIDRSLAQWLDSRDVSLIGTWSSSESDREFDATGSSHVLANVMLAMIPMLGFIGTVLGLSGAVSNFSQFLSGSVEMSQIKDALRDVTAGLGTAFDTTLLALVLSIALTFPMALMIRRENDLLSEFDSYMDDKIISKLPPSEPLTIKIENLEDSIDAAFRRYIPDPDRYDEVFARAIDRAGITVEERFSGLVSSYEGSVSQLTASLSGSLASAGNTVQASMTDAATNLAGSLSAAGITVQSSLSDIASTVSGSLATAGDSVEASMRSVVSDVAKQDEQMVLNRRSIAEEETNRLKGMLDEYAASTDALKLSTEEGMRNTVGAAQSLGAKLAEVQNVAEQVDQLLRLEKSVEHAIAGLSATEEFKETLGDLRKHLETTDEFCKEMKKPKVITLREEYS